MRRRPTPQIYIPYEHSVLEARRRVLQKDRVRYQGIPPLSRPKFRRFLVGQLSHEQLRLVHDVLSANGVRTLFDGDLVWHDHRAMSFDLHEDTHWIEVGDSMRLDALVDMLFLDMLEADPRLRVRCADCYSHFTPTEYLLDVPRSSVSCEASQHFHPVRLYYPDRPKDTVFL